MSDWFDIAWYDVVGTSGVALIVLAYILLLGERLSSRALAYSLLNLLGAVMITVSLLYEFNLSAFIIEMFWIAASVYGIVQSLKHRPAG